MNTHCYSSCLKAHCFGFDNTTRPFFYPHRHFLACCSLSLDYTGRMEANSTRKQCVYAEGCNHRQTRSTATHSEATNRNSQLGYVETDLAARKRSLDGLNENLTSLSTFSIARHGGKALVQDISLNFIEQDDLFERVSSNDVRLKKNGQAAIHDALKNRLSRCFWELTRNQHMCTINPTIVHQLVDGLVIIICG